MAEDRFVVDVPRIGRAELLGSGPWSVHEQGRGSFEIVDANLRPAKTILWRSLSGGSGGGKKPDANIVWASKSVPNVIVEAANKAWTERT